MQTRVWILTLAVVGLLGWFGRGAFSEEGEGMPSKAEMEQMEKMMEQLATPGEMHQWLAKASGNWTLRGEFHEMDGSKQLMCGRACFRMILGGRWQEQTFSGTYRGKPFGGHGITGFDNEKKQFTNYWFDTMSTSTAPASGTLSEDGTTLTMAGEWEMMGQKMPFRQVITWLNACQMRFQMYMTWQGNESLAGEIVYSRR